MKTKIYQTIKSLIILFIKLQSFNQVQQALKPLHILISNLDLNLNLNPNDLVICIISDVFVSSPICLMILDVSRGLYASNQVKSKPTYSSGLGATGLYTKRLLSS